MPDLRKRFTPEFRVEAVRLARTSGRSRRAVAEALGIGISTLRHWIDGRRERAMEAPLPDHQEDMAAELKRLRRENEVLRQEREILKRTTAFFRQGGKPMRFRLIDVAKEESPVQRLCKILEVSPSGYFALVEPARIPAPMRGPGAARARALVLQAAE